MADYSKALNDAFKKTIKNKNKGAISAIVFDDEKILYSFYDGFINKEKKIAPKADSLFMVGSNTKVMTSLGIFRLLEDGKLSLDDPITKFIPDFSVKSRIGEYEVTIENLLMHRGGIQCDLYPYIIGTKHHFSEVVDGLKETYRTSIPGTMFAYSNLGYTLLGIIIEKASGKPYADFLQEVLFAPLDMEVYFKREDELPETLSDRVARSYDKKGKHTIDPLGGIIPAGSNTYTTMGSLAKVGQLIMNDGECNGVRLYKPETIQLMKTLKIDDDWDKELGVVGYGLFHHANKLDYKTGRSLGHGGDTLYHHSMFDFLPDEKLGVIVFGNFETAPMLARKVEIGLFNTYLKEAGFPKKERKETFVDFDPKDYVKKYDSVMGPIEFSVSPKGELCTKMSKVPFTLKLNDEGWLIAKPKPIWAKLPPIAESLEGIKFCQTKYFGNDVLLLEQQGSKGTIGELYYEPGVNHAWLKALGTYKLRDKEYKSMFSKVVLSVKDGGISAAVYIEGTKMESSISVINDTEAVVKGYGRNARETMFLKENNGNYELTTMGLVFDRVKGK